MTQLNEIIAKNELAQLKFEQLLTEVSNYKYLFFLTPTNNSILIYHYSWN